MAINYADSFETELQQKYARELTSSALTTEKARFVGAKNVKIPRLTLSGYKDHTRSKGYNAGTLSNDYEIKTLAHDRDIEFFVDAEDIDETNQILSAANITNTFTQEHAIPELDCYRYSKLYTELATTYSKTVDTTELSAANVLVVFDELMEKMDEAGVPESGRILYVTPTVRKYMKEASDVQKVIIANGQQASLKTIVHSIDDVQITMVPSARMKTVYNFTDGCVPGTGAKQINMILIHPSCVIAPVKRNSIYLWEPGTHTEGDGWLYQNRSYTDLFLIENKADGCQMNVEA